MLKQQAAGFTLMETLVVMSIAALIFSLGTADFLNTLERSRDKEIRETADLGAEYTVQLMGLELRSLGNGVPFNQANFEIDEYPTILADSTVAEPIVVATANESNITFRLNESGEVYILTQDFQPSASLQIFLHSVDDLYEDDTIYLANSTVAEHDGFYGVIESVDPGTNSVTVLEDYQVSTEEIFGTEATFAMGATCERVSEITYNSPLDGSGMTKDLGDGAGPIQLVPNSTFSLRYLDFNGAEMTLPLVNTDLIEALRSIEVTINVSGKKLLPNGAAYTASAVHTFALRNLSLAF